jgi:hypothetical protein
LSRGIALFAIGLIPAWLIADPAPIFKSVDEHGRVTYSSEPPVEAVAVEQLDISNSVAETDAQGSNTRTRQMMEFARELEESRLAIEEVREKERAERQRLAREEDEFQRQQDLLDQIGRSYNRGYWWPYRPVIPPVHRPGKPPGHGGGQPRPPVAIPLPSGGAAGVPASGN